MKGPHDDTKDDADKKTKTSILYNEYGVTIDAEDTINATRSPYDKKLYRHITIQQNGIQAILIQDTIAMMQQQTRSKLQEYDDEDEEDDDGGEEFPMNDHDKLDDDEENDDADDDDDDDSNLLRDASCSVVVGVGSVSDTIDGLAHFCEHLLFMGSQKYPDENEYSSYVSKYGGTENAFTEWEYTIYNVTIPNEALWGAIDRLAQFFIAPLFVQDAVDREIKSIESEFVLHTNDDSVRKQQLICSTSNKDHPICKFSWGNIESLQMIPQRRNIDPMKELYNFYYNNYYSQNIRIVIQGAYTLDELQEGIVKYFSDVPSYPRANIHNPEHVEMEEEVATNDMPTSNDVAHYSGSSKHTSKQEKLMKNAGLPFHSNIFGTITRIVPVKECHNISITWQLPSQLHNWKSKPVNFISHLLGHEASGSILSYLRSKSYATACVAGYAMDDGASNATSHALFSVAFTLSENGVHRWHEVIVAIYEYIAMLRKCCSDGWPRFLFDELQQIDKLAYKYSDEPSPDETVEHIAEQMAPYQQQYKPIERILDGDALLFEFDETTIESLLCEYIKPELGRIDLTSSFFGKSSEYDSSTSDANGETTSTIVTDLVVGEATKFDEMNTNDNAESFLQFAHLSKPQVDPMFGTRFWCHKLPSSCMSVFIDSADPNIRNTIELLHLPPNNPYIPHNFDIKAFPHDDSDHPLLNAAIKLCIVVGKTKQWFPATVIRYNQKLNRILCSYEDEDEKWHELDHDISEFNDELLCRFDSFEGTMDKKVIKFRIVAVALYPGMKGAVRMYGDETDVEVEDGTIFPPIPSPSKHLPVQISNSNVLKMWWLQDRKFKRPIAEFRIQVICQHIVREPLHRACADLLRKLCADALMEVAYLAEMCELECSVDATDTGFYIRFHGFNDKLLDLFVTVFSLLLSFVDISDELPEAISIDRFNSCLEILKRQYKNSGSSASSWSNGIRLRAIRPTIYSSSQKLKQIDGISVRTFCKTISMIFQSFSVEAFIHGNVGKDDANKARDTLLQMLDGIKFIGLARKQYPAQSVLRIPNTLSTPQIIVPSLNPTDLNTSCDVYIQVGKDNVRDRVVLDLLLHMMDNPIYDQIRTKDQFGYEVYCDVRWSFGILGCIFHVTTNVKSGTEVVKRIDKFLTDFRTDLIDMSAADFHEHLVGLAKQKLEMYNSLSEESDSFWSEIDCGRFEWEAWRNETVQLKEITKDDVVTALDQWMLPGKKRQVLSVQVIGAGKAGASMGRPVLEENQSITEYADEKVKEFHTICKNQFWGRVNSKLF